MTRKEAFSAIRKLLFADETNQAKTKDGQIIQWAGELIEGAALSKVGEDGSVTPCEDSTFEMEDGSKVTTVGGMVTKIEAKTEESTDEEMSEFEKLFAKHIEDFTKFSERFTALETKLSEYDTKFTEMAEAHKATDKTVATKFEKLGELVELIAAEPAEKVDPPSTNPFKKVREGKSKVELFLDYQREKKV